MRGFEGDLGDDASRFRVSQCAEPYECRDHPPAGVCVRAVLGVEPIELVNSIGQPTEISMRVETIARLAGVVAEDA